MPATGAVRVNGGARMFKRDRSPLAGARESDAGKYQPSLRELASGEIDTMGAGNAPIRNTHRVLEARDTT